MFQIQKPFNLVDIMGEENEEWDFAEDDNINVFTYLSLHGSGKWKEQYLKYASRQNSSYHSRYTHCYVYLR